MYAIRNISLCTKDCLCLYVCPTGATDTETGQIDAEKCISGCRACIDACPSHAISLIPETFPNPQQKNKRISGEVCVHYMWFSDKDYEKFGGFIKCNPAIKSELDKKAIIKGVKEGIVKVVATDHAPHLKEEKTKPYQQCPSGMPEIRHSLQMMLELSSQGIFTKEEVVARMCHGPAECFGVEKRGFLREGFYADIAIVNPNEKDSHSTAHPPYKCGWSPLNGVTFCCSIVHTFVNGTQVVKNGNLLSRPETMPLRFTNDTNAGEARKNKR